MEPAGFFGKIPSHGDFVSRRLPAEFLRAWDAWLQRCIAQSRAALGEAWLDRYLNSPIWRFAMTAGVCGPVARIGLLMPSVDRVGRYFPLSIVSPVAPGASALSFAISARQWFDAAESLLLTVLTDAPPGLDVFDQQVTGLTDKLLDLDDLRRPTAEEGERGPYWQLEVYGETSPGLAIASLAGGMIVDLVGPASWWWMSASDNGPARYLAVRDLPGPAAYVSLLGAAASPAIPEDWQEAPRDAVPARGPESPPHPLPVEERYTEAELRQASASLSTRDSGATLSLEALINMPLDLTYESSSRTETGNVRRDNEDSVLDDVGRGIWVVADGMGGHAAGKTASTAIVSALQNADLPEDLDHAIETVIQCLHAVNRELRTYARHRRESRGLGSTVAVMLARRSNAAIVWVGDSRVYRMRGQHLDQLTIDHSEHQERLERGDIATILGTDTHAVTRAVGGEDMLRTSTLRQGLQPGDRFLICSDGVYQEVPAYQLAQHLDAGTSGEASDAIIDAVLEGRAADNASAVVVDVIPAGAGAGRP